MTGGRWQGPRPESMWRVVRVNGDRPYSFWTIQYGASYGVHRYGWEYAHRIPALVKGQRGGLSCTGNRCFPWRPLSELPAWAAEGGP